MKKFAVFFVVISACSALFGHGPMHGPRIHHAYPPRHHFHHGGPFWTGVGIGLVGGVLAAPILSAASQRVWIPPVYGERPIYRAGIFVGVERYVVTPGYWTTTY